MVKVKVLGMVFEKNYLTVRGKLLCGEVTLGAYFSTKNSENLYKNVAQVHYSAELLQSGIRGLVLEIIQQERELKKGECLKSVDIPDECAKPATSGG